MASLHKMEFEILSVRLTIDLHKLHLLYSLRDTKDLVLILGMCSSTMPEKMITVAVTPNGYADGLSSQHPSGEEFFVMPEEQTMSMTDFIGHLDDSNDVNVYYIQKQNSNLINDLPELHEDVDINTLLFASEAFNKQPDAVNFWMGDKRAITSSTL